MKKNALIAGLMLSSTCLPLTAAEHPEVFPKPQQIELKSGYTHAEEVIVKIRTKESSGNVWEKLPEGNAGANWFDDPAAIAARQAFKYPKGYYSIKDKVGVLMANPETAAILGEAMKAVMAGSSSMMGEGMEMGESMKEFMNMMRLSDMLKMMGAGIPAEVKLELNEALTKIKK